MAKGSIEMKTKFLRGFFIDPFKAQVHAIEIVNEIHVWHQVLMCDCFTVCRLGAPYAGCKLDLDIWVDDNGLLREPVWPRFKIRNGLLCGYGLVLATNSSGESVSVPEVIDVPSFAKLMAISFEPYQIRLDPGDYIEQITRSLELELPGLVRYCRGQ